MQSIKYSGRPVRDDKMLAELKEFPFMVGDKTVYVPVTMITPDEEKNAMAALPAPEDKTPIGTVVDLLLPISFAEANGLPLPASETGISTDVNAGAGDQVKPLDVDQAQLAGGTSMASGSLTIGPGDTVDSAGDDRTANNVMRHAYRILTDAEKALMQEIKDLGLQMHTLLDSFVPSREIEIAKTKNEEAVMWAVKHLTK